MPTCFFKTFISFIWETLKQNFKKEMDIAVKCDEVWIVYPGLVKERKETKVCLFVSCQSIGESAAVVGTRESSLIAIGISERANLIPVSRGYVLYDSFFFIWTFGRRDITTWKNLFVP